MQGHVKNLVLRVRIEINKKKEVSGMNPYFVGLEIKDDEIERIMKELDEAQETIYRCYVQLKDLGVLTITQAKAASGN